MFHKLVLHQINSRTLDDIVAASTHGLQRPPYQTWYWSQDYPHARSSSKQYWKRQIRSDRSQNCRRQRTCLLQKPSCHSWCWFRDCSRACSSSHQLQNSRTIAQDKIRRCLRSDEQHAKQHCVHKNTLLKLITEMSGVSEIHCSKSVQIFIEFLQVRSLHM